MTALRDALALDIGGANLKAAHTDGTVRIVPFALWQRPTELAGALRDLLADSPAADRLAVTMTGELCDCFATKADGVGAILDAVAEAAGERDVRVFQTDARFVDPETARSDVLATAASNWLALAVYAARLVGDDAAVLVDIGSTTTDLIPLHHGRPCPRRRIDPGRLTCGELVYTGVRRTPVCALIHAVTFPDGTRCRVAAERFATTHDAYVHTGDMPGAPDDRSTADGRPATKAFARARLARMICADASMLSDEQIDAIARAVADTQRSRIALALGEAVTHLAEPPAKAVIAGEGEFLARRILEGGSSMRPEIISFAERFGRDASHAACAFALAHLAAEDETA